MRRAILSIAVSLLFMGCAIAPSPAPPILQPTAINGVAAISASAVAEGNSARWPDVRSKVSRSPEQETRVNAILARMSVEEKVGQIIQPDIASITPADVRKYKFGSILAGGNSAPGGNDRAPAAEWLKLADEYWKAARSAQWSGEAIPLMWGIDAVHGHANVVGATIFPQNIGLGAARNPDLIRRIGQVTAKEMVVTGFDWDFSPTLAVVRDDRWGRSYEGFSEDPRIVASYAGPLVEGLQGKAGTPDFLGPGHVIATAKHFVGDGGTTGGRDQGDNPSNAADIRDIAGAGYPPAISEGVQAVMASFSSVRGVRMHGNRDLLSGALKGDMNFDALVVGDWNGHGQVPGCSNTDCPAAINAGLDMFMAPDSWKDLYDNTLRAAKDGTIPIERLDDAVRRILRVKLRAGLFEKDAPSTRPFAGRFDLLASSAHRAVARQAVRESLVLLKNNGNILPLSPGKRILVTGDGANDISKQSGGWTITWQGNGLTNADFPHGESIWSGIDRSVKTGGGSAELSRDGKYKVKPDAAIVVFGEQPYAEMVGDRSTLEFSPADKTALDLLKRLRAEGIPTVSVFLSGRPMWVNPELNASDAFVAAFLPGSEGGGVADLLIARPDGQLNADFRGKLSFSWPRRADQTSLNVGDAGYDPLFALGYGLTYADRQTIALLSEDRPPPSSAAGDGIYFARGTLPPGWQLDAVQGATVTAVDRYSQEDSRKLNFTGRPGQAVALKAAQALDLDRETNADLSLAIEMRRDSAATGSASVAVGCVVDCQASIDIGPWLAARPVGDWGRLIIPLSCFKDAGADMARIGSPFILSSDRPLAVTISGISIVSVPKDRTICGR